jgi:hypothetical protein
LIGSHLLFFFHFLTELFYFTIASLIYNSNGIAIYASHPNGLGYPYPGYWCTTKAPGWLDSTNQKRRDGSLYCTDKGWMFRRFNR